jgi:hypothetical protein
MTGGSKEKKNSGTRVGASKGEQLPAQLQSCDKSHFKLKSKIKKIKKKININVENSYYMYTTRL